MKPGIKSMLLLMLTLMLALSFAGCRQSDTNTPAVTASTAPAVTQSATAASPDATDEPGGLKLPIVDEPLTLTYWVPFRAANAKIMSSFSEADAWVELMDRTGVTIECIHPTIGQEKDAYQLMIVSNELPDIIEMNGLGGDLYTGGSDQAIEDGVYLRLNEYIDQYAPNFKALLDSDPEIAKAVKTDSGNIWAFQMIELQAQPAYMGPAVRKDWLDDLGLDTPRTIDDWHTMLTEFKDKKGAVSPLLLEANGISAHGVLISAYGVINDFYQDNGTVKFGAVEPGFKDYVATMNEWYSEGLIDSQFVSYDGYQGTNTMSKLVGGEAAALSTGFWVLQVYLAATDDPDFLMDAVPYPSLEEGQSVVLRQFNEKVRNDAPTVVTTSCEHPEVAVQLLDYGYSPEGFLLLNYGIEGKSYELLDETPAFPSLSDKVPMFTDYVMNNEDFPIYNDILTIAARHAGPFVRDELNRSSFTTSELGLHAQNEVWFGDNSGMLPKLMSLTAEEAAEFNTTMSDIKTYINEMVPKFIMGVESMDNYDSFVEQINTMGIDRMIEIKQASLDRYNNR